MEYNPDSWVIVKINSSTPHYRVVGGWNGSYAYGNSWRINSGIKSVSFDKKTGIYSLHGFSGSVYFVHKDAERVTIANSDGLEYLKKSNTPYEIITLQEAIKEL